MLGLVPGVRHYEHCCTWIIHIAVQIITVMDFLHLHQIEQAQAIEDTVCPRGTYPFYILNYFIKLISTTSKTYSTTQNTIFMGEFLSMKWIIMKIITRNEDPDPLIFGPPDPDPTCNNGFIKLFSS